ncbi:MAG: DUF411 domain-containing protein [Hyphomicrobiaceae bacterium]
MPRMLYLAVVAGALVVGLAFAVPVRAETVHVAKTASCGCCGLWIEHLKKNGFSVTAENVAHGTLARLKLQAGLKNPELHSCHTAKVAGYVIEGHVPAAVVKRLLAEKPVAIGLTVPGMPLGSPGMEAGDRREPYDVLLVKRDGSTAVFARH